MNNSCLDGMGVLGSLDSNNKKARVVKDEGCLSWTRAFVASKSKIGNRKFASD